MSQEYNLHFIRKRKRIFPGQLSLFWTFDQKRHQQNLERVREQKDQGPDSWLLLTLCVSLQISELNPSEIQHDIYVLWAIFHT